MNKPICNYSLHAADLEEGTGGSAAIKTEKIFRFPPGIPPAGNGQMTLEREKLIEVILRSRDLFFETLSLSDTHNDLGKHSLGNRGEACELGRPHSTAFGC